jgi:hypothetical protein
MTSCADQCRFAGSHRTIARARMASPAALSTRPIGTPSTAADMERQQPGPALRITPRRPCGCGTAGLADQNADHWRRPLLTQNGSGWLITIVITGARRYGCGSGSLADTAADHRRLPILVRISIRGRSADWHKYKRTSEGTDKPSLWKGKSPIRGAYMISPAYRSARNDKFCLYSTLVLLRMIFIFTDRPWGLRPRYASSRTLDTPLAGSNFPR